MGDDLLIVRAGEVEALLSGREAELLDLVAQTYVIHGRGRSSVPHSTFLRFPGDSLNRIIALPAHLGDGMDIAGVKWIASFPRNIERGMQRASAVIVLNSCETGRPTSILEGSTISARRTAASAALAARELSGAVHEAGLIGAGLINWELARFLTVAIPTLERLVVFDLVERRSADLAKRITSSFPGITADPVATIDDVMVRCRLVSFATTAVHPHVHDLSRCPKGATILHISLRDLGPEAVLRADNVVDDPDHVTRAQTSVHLAEQRVGSRDFIRCTLAQILEGVAPPKTNADQVTVFSPFGLGVLDLAVAHRVATLAREKGLGLPVEAFLPRP